MADETIIDKAMALLPGSGAKKKRASGNARHKQLGAIQKKLAALSRNVEKLAATIAADAKKAMSSKPAGKKPAKKPGARAASAGKPAAKKPAARKPAAKKPGTAKKSTGGGRRAAKS